MMRATALLAALLLAACAGAGGADTATPPELWRLTDYAEASQCTPERAVRVKISDITTNMARYHRTCVTVEGILYGGRLFQTRDDLYRVSTRTRRGHRSDADIKVELSEGVELPEGHRVAEMTGIAIACELANREDEVFWWVRLAADVAAPHGDPQVIVRADGDCDPWRASQLFLTRLELNLGNRPVRLLPHSQTQELGDLQRVDTDSPSIAHATRAAELALALVAGNDSKALAEMLTHGLSGWEVHEVADLVEQMLSDERMIAWPGARTIASPFIRAAARVKPQRAVFAYRPAPALNGSRWADAYQDTYVVCYCAELDCTRTWPIDSMDAGFNAERPYACFAVWLDHDSEPAVAAFYTPLELTEPPRTGAP